MMNRQKGLSLVELSVVLVVLGLVGVLAWQFIAMTVKRHQLVEANLVLNDADQALTNFAFINHRLPCPDTTHDGLENCGAAAVGSLPWRTLGVPLLDARQLRYGIYRDVGNTIDLSAVSDRSTLYFSIDGVLQGQHPGTQNGLDLCRAMEDAVRAPTNVGLHDAIDLKPLAYALAWPGLIDADNNKNLFDQGNGGTGTVFAPPSEPGSPTYDDTVRSVSLHVLWDRLSCGANLSASDHAAENVEVASDLLLKAAQGEQQLLKVALLLAKADNTAASAGIAQATAGISSALSDTFSAIAEALLTDGATAPIVAWGVAATAANTAALVLAITDQVYAAMNVTSAQQTYDQSQTYIDNITALRTTTLSDALALDADGLAGQP